MNLNEHINILRHSYKCFRDATGFTLPDGTLQFGSTLDSYGNREFREAALAEAVNTFIKSHKREILDVAMDMVKEELDSVNIAVEPKEEEKEDKDES